MGPTVPADALMKGVQEQDTSTKIARNGERRDGMTEEARDLRREMAFLITVYD